MKTIKILMLAGAICLLLNSCVYSLFPIYTEETLLYKEELIGKWITNEETAHYVKFEPYSKETAESDPVEDKQEYEYKVQIREGFSITSDEPISNDLIEKLKDTNFDQSEIKQEKVSKDKIKSQVDFSGTVVTHHDESYLMTVKTDEKYEKYIAHLTDIGGDLFLDLYPITAFSSGAFSDNYFPVHTFLKIAVNEKKMDLTFFNLEKLNELFESNLIRLRHETVDGVVLITAKPEELRKFLNRYSDDESVFEDTKVYNRVSS